MKSLRCVLGIHNVYPMQPSGYYFYRYYRCRRCGRTWLYWGISDWKQEAWLNATEVDSLGCGGDFKGTLLGESR